MRIKVFESYFNLSESNITVNNPNFSIVVPGGCNGKCNFCFWQKTKPCGNYINILSETLSNLPSQFYQISLTGGEPTISPYLKSILETINKKKFTKVVLTTNGSNLLETIPMLEGKVDHINISRHHFEEDLNNNVFKARMINNRQLKNVISELNKVGIDVTLSAVLNENLKSKKDIKDYINFARTIGASQVFFRKPHGTLEPTKVEKAFESYKGFESSCPVCRTKNQLIEGIRVSWKASLEEPSSVMDKIYELIFHEDGTITKDWEGKLKVDVSIISERQQFINEGYQSMNEQCGGSFSSGCGGWQNEDRPARRRRDEDGGFGPLDRNIPRQAMPPDRVPRFNPGNSRDSLLRTLYDYYIMGDAIKNGDMVIYHNSGKKYDGETFTFQGIREGDGKFRLSKDGTVFYASPDKVTREDGHEQDRIEKFKKLTKTMIENGDFTQKEVDAFLGRKENDPFDEENWD